MAPAPTSIRHDADVDVSVVIPCYRSRKTLGPLLEELIAVLPEVTDRFEVILVVDGSPDDTYAIVRRWERQHPETVRGVLLRRNYGQHNALFAGIQRARYGVVVTMDDDQQHRPDTIGSLLAPLTDPLVDLVYGTAEVEEHGVLRSLASRGVKRALSVAGVPDASKTSAFRAFRTELREGMVSDPVVNVDVMLSWSTTAIHSVEVPMRLREEGDSSYTWRSLTRHAMNMITGYSTVPLRLVSVLGLLCAAFGLVLVVVVLIGYLIGSTTVAGFTTIVAAIALFSGAQMLCLGVLGEYLGRLHSRSQGQPGYLVRVEPTVHSKALLESDSEHERDDTAEATERISQWRD